MAYPADSASAPSSGTHRGGAGAAAFGAYVHVPFCRRRCDYCAFATWSDRGHLIERYVSACQLEARRISALGRGPATSVFFGGGTPSLLPAELLLAVLDALKAGLGLAAGAEVTVECNPETVSMAKLAAYRAGGVTRLSFGATHGPHVLASLGREHDPSSVRRVAQLAGEAGFAGAYSVDLIFGAAGESMADWEASLEGVLGLDPPPGHVSAYALTVEAGTPLAHDPARHPDEGSEWRRQSEVRPGEYWLDPREDQNVILPTNWMLRGWVTVPFQVPKVALEGSLLNGMQSPKASPSQVK